MSSLITVSLNLDKIDKEKIIKGKKGKYLNITFSVNDEEDQYGNNVSVWHSQSKEERDAKKDRIFLGNGRVVWTDGKPVNETTENSSEEEDSDLPF